MRDVRRLISGAVARARRRYASAPIAVVRGGTLSGRPCTSAAALRPAIRPDAADSTYPSTPDTCPAKNRSSRVRVCHVSRRHRRAVDVRVAVHHPEPHELGLLEARNHPQHARLFAPLQLRLKAHQAEVIAGERVLTQLHDGIRTAPGSRIGEAHRLHRPEAQRVVAAMRHHFDRQAALEELLLVEVVHRRRFRADDRLIERARIRPASADNSDNRPAHRRHRTLARHRRRTCADAAFAPAPGTLRTCAPAHLREDSVPTARPETPSNDRWTRPGRSG